VESYRSAPGKGSPETSGDGAQDSRLFRNELNPSGEHDHAGLAQEGPQPDAVVEQDVPQIGELRFFALSVAIQLRVGTGGRLIDPVRVSFFQHPARSRAVGLIFRGFSLPRFMWTTRQVRMVAAVAL
jgi:hypothetical protein